MRHSRFTQSYTAAFPSLEVTEAEILDRRSSKGWTCQTIAQMDIPHADLSKKVETKAAVKSCKPEIVRRVHSIADAHRLTIHRNVARRMQAAKERGDEQLLCALEAELRETISA
ncbi:hypothetical protein [Leptolyngbya sp. NIES-2104]|uniref:hypothetical protein n=1 Tax=Leptolyngbya sp. NIES-2104 TaxID=1552121 RepID=UPI0006EC8F2E|nr:hypothetical protein [Leptolyngbya sp. NIES-2104]GAP93499.1 hypothetical protein NIES2104_00050 [Leptolyngbya sp. NIES-2104]